jgi:hypothetical protein
LAIGALVLAQIAFPPIVLAQSLPDHQWRHGSTLEVFAGSAMAPSAETRHHGRRAFGWEINHRISVEGSGAWLLTRQEDEGLPPN